MIGNSERGFVNNRLYEINFISFFVNSLVDEGDAADAIYLDFSKTFDIIPITVS